MARAPSKPAAQSENALPTAETRVLILHGKDRFLQDQYLRTLRDALTKKHGGEGFDTVRFDGAQGARIVADVLDELRSFGLMQQHKVVLVDNAELLLKGDDDDAPASKAGGAFGSGALGSGALGSGKRRVVTQSPRELIEGYCESPSDSATLVLKAGVWRPGNLDKAVLALADGTGIIAKCEPPDEAKAASWAKRRCQSRHNSTINDESLRLLIGAVGSDLGRIDNELEKLALAAGGAGEAITADLVRTMVGVTREEDFWAIQGELLSNDAHAALAQLRQLVEVSRHDPVPITFAYTEMARKVHVAARGISEGVHPSKLAGALRVWGPDRERISEGVFALARQLGPVGAAELLRAAVGVDAANKSGLGEPVRNIERLTIRFTRPGQTSSARVGVGR